MRVSQHTVKVDTTATVAIAAAVAAVKYRVKRFFLVAAGTVTVKFQAGSTDLTGPMTMAAGVPLTDRHLTGLEVPANTALNLTLGGVVQVSGYVVYEHEGVDS